MAEKKSIDDVIAKDAVTNVHPETPGERIFRLIFADLKRFAAMLLILLGVFGSILIIALVQELRSNAFQLFSAIVTGALGYVFGSKSDR